MRSQTKGTHRDLVEELIGEEVINDYTHRPDGSFEILNDIVVDRGPNPSRSSVAILSSSELILGQQCQLSRSSAMTNILRQYKPMVSA